MTTPNTLEDLAFKHVGARTPTTTTAVSSTIRDTAKRQIAATRHLIAQLNTCASRPPGSAQGTEAIREAFKRLDRTTEDLARNVYTPDGSNA